MFLYTAQKKVKVKYNFNQLWHKLLEHSLSPAFRKFKISSVQIWLNLSKNTSFQIQQRSLRQLAIPVVLKYTSNWFQTIVTKLLEVSLSLTCRNLNLSSVQIWLNVHQNTSVQIQEKSSQAIQYSCCPWVTDFLMLWGRCLMSCDILEMKR